MATLVQTELAARFITNRASLFRRSPKLFSRSLATTAADASNENSPRPTANIVLIGAGWWSQGWHLPHLDRNEKVNISAIVGEHFLSMMLINEFQLTRIFSYSRVST